MSIVREMVTLLRYQVDNDGLRQYQEAWEGLMGRVRDGFGHVREAGLGAIDGVREGLRDAVDNSRDLVSAQRESTAETGRQSSGFRKVAGWIKIAVGYLSARRILDYVDSWGQMEARMRQATSSAQEYAGADKEIARISRLTYKSYSDNAELFVRTRRTMADLGKSTQDTIDLTEALSLGMALSSTKAADQESAISSVSKSIMQGKMGMSEYETLMRTMPRLQVALADGLGTTTDKLLGMVKAGQVTTNKLLPALQSQLAKMRLEAENMPVTMADAFTVLNDAAQRFFGRTVSWGRRSVLSLTRSIEWLADNIEDVAKAVGLLGLAYAFSAGRAALMSAVGAAGSLTAAIAKMRVATLAWLLPFVKIAAVLGTIYLIGQDVWVWLQGGESLLGSLVGGVDQWRDRLEAVAAPAREIWGLIEAIGVEIGNAIAEMFDFEGGFTTLSEVATAALGGILTGLSWLLTQAKHLLAAFLAILRGDWDAAGEHISAAIKGWLAPLERLADKATDVMKRIGQAIQEWVIGKLQQAKQWMADLLPDFRGMGQRASAAMSGWVDRAKGALGIEPAIVQGAGRGPGNTTMTVQQTVGQITVNAPNASPAAVAAGVERGIGQGLNRYGNPYGSEVPMIEAMP